MKERRFRVPASPDAEQRLQLFQLFLSEKRDDFGRQLVRPRDLLNRWIVPLENRIDYMTLHTGRKVEIPFDVLVLFSTNLPPRDLVDEAFLRRLRHKIEVTDPSYESYRQIFQDVAEQKGVIYRDQGLAYLLQEWYISRSRKLRSFLDT